MDSPGPVRVPPLAAQAASKLEEMITSERWPVGSRIPTESELAASWDLSRNTIREALRSLVHAGLIESRAGDGTYVRASSELVRALRRRAARAPMRESIEVRLMIERQIARLAAARRTPEQIEALSAAQIAARDAVAAGDPVLFAQADAALHATVAACAGNALLADMAEHLAGAFKLAEQPELWDAALAVEELDYHQVLIDAIAAGDVVAAERAAADLIGLLRDQLSEEFAE